MKKKFLVGLLLASSALAFHIRLMVVLWVVPRFVDIRARERRNRKLDVAMQTT